MLKNLLIILIINATSTIFAQTSIEKELKGIENQEQADDYLNSKNSKKNKLITFNEEKHKTKLAQALFKKNVGETEVVEREYENVYYKVISRTNNTYNRVSYIYLNSNEYAITDLNTIREKIIFDYQNGVPFEYLAKQYSMGANSEQGGDSSWFSKGKLDTPLQEGFTNTNYQLNDNYMVDLPESNRYYVVLKTHNPKVIPELQVLKIIEKK